MVCSFVREDLDVFVAVDLGVCFCICKFLKDPYLMTRKKLMAYSSASSCVSFGHHNAKKYYQNVNSVINN